MTEGTANLLTVETAYFTARGEYKLVDEGRAAARADFVSDESCLHDSCLEKNYTQM